ncbi:MFS polyamine transporter [Gymnopus androsaceus JB14]|uniref:MFS polyamine transporter n=1 Tax=Gymnopus androsaceus JB14 TaxID=1447944 RepID=A0A6A4GR09_9AGAR|nr:MFS polyamine transporter [Gymnopus androsaceus JB14]
MHPSTSTVPRSHPDSSPNSTSSSSNPSSNIATPTPTIIEDSAPKTVEQKEMLEEETQAEEEADSQTIVVDWDGADDPTNPKNWSFGRKWAATFIVSSFTFISPVSSSMVAPATDVIAQQFGITNTVILAMTTSIFILAYAIGPLFLGPLSEIYGRSRVLQAANMFYLVWNLVCGFAQNTTQLLVFRFLAGLGGSAPLAIGGGVLGDVWSAEERGKAIAVYSLAPLMGPVVGPIAGAWIAEKSTWRWVFWSTTIVDGAIQVAGCFSCKRVSFAPLLLERKAVKIRKAIEGDPEKGLNVKDVKTVYSNVEGRTWQVIFSKALTRPFALFAREPIAQVIGLYMAFVYGIFYIFLTTIPTIFTNVYHQSTGIGGLNYIGLGIGLTFASQINARYMDKIYIYFKNKNGGVGEPEFRVPSMILGSLLLPCGLVMSGWAAQEGVHWVVTDIGMALVGAGIILTFQSMQTYVVDCFTLHAASALAAVSCLRALAGFGFPLFAPAMYDALGYGKSDTILAAVSIAIGWPAPLVFWKYGKRIRMKSKYAKKH